MAGQVADPLVDPGKPDLADEIDRRLQRVNAAIVEVAVLETARVGVKQRRFVTRGRARQARTRGEWRLEARNQWLAAVEKAEAMGAEQAFLRSAGQGVDPLIGDIERHRPDGLDRIDDQQRSLSAAAFAKPLQIEPLSGAVADGGDGNHPCGGVDPGQDIVEHDGRAVALDHPDLDAAPPQIEPAMQIVRMLQGMHDHVVPGPPREALRNRVEPFGGILDESDFRRTGTDRPGDLGAE